MVLDFYWPNNFKEIEMEGVFKKDILI